MPPSQEALLKRVERDRDFALRALKRGFTDPDTVRKLVARLKESGFQEKLSDIMVREGHLTADQCQEIEGQAPQQNEPLSASETSITPEVSSLPGYDIIENLASGRAGRVYRVRGQKDGQEYALRVLPEAFLKDPNLFQRFQDRWNRVHTFRHAMLSELGTLHKTDDLVFYTMEFVKGPSLGDVLRQNRPFPSPLARSFVQVLTNVVAKAHETSLVHRDLNPHSLVFLPNRQMRLREYGLERVICDLCGEQEPDTIRCFRSPEDLKGDPPRKEDDLFGLGALLFFVTTGRRPPRANQSGNVALPDLGNYPDLGLDIISLITRLLLPRLARLSTTRELLAALEKPPTAPHGSQRQAAPTPLHSSHRAPELKVEEPVNNGGFSGFGASPIPTAAFDRQQIQGNAGFGASPMPQVGQDSEFYEGADAETIRGDISGEVQLYKGPDAATIRGDLADSQGANPDSTIREDFSGKYLPPPSSQPQAPSRQDYDAATVRSGELSPNSVKGKPAFDFNAPMPASSLGKDVYAPTVVDPQYQASNAPSDPTAETIMDGGVVPQTDPAAETIMDGGVLPQTPMPRSLPPVDSDEGYETVINEEQQRALQQAAFKLAGIPSRKLRNQAPVEETDPNAETIVPGGANPLLVNSLNSSHKSQQKDINEEFDSAAATLVGGLTVRDLSRLVDDDDDDDDDEFDPNAETLQGQTVSPAFSAQDETVLDMSQHPDVLRAQAQKRQALKDQASPPSNFDVAAKTLLYEADAQGQLASVKMASPLKDPKAKLATPPESFPKDSSCDEDQSQPKPGEDRGPISTHAAKKSAPLPTFKMKRLTSRLSQDKAAGAGVGKINDEVIGGYTIEQTLHDHGPWTYYQATKETEWVHIRLLRTKPSDPSIDRIIKEAKLQKSVKHPYLQTTKDVGQFRDDVLYVIEKPPVGLTAKEVLAWGGLEFKRAAERLMEMIKAVGAIHKKGLVHGNIHDQNTFIYREGGHEKLIVTQMTSRHLWPQKYYIDFTSPFDAPEVRGCANRTQASDLYSVGIMAYRLFTGCLPCKKDETEPQDFKTLRSDWMPPAGLEDFCLRAIAVDPAQRFISADDMAAALQKLLDSAPKAQPKMAAPESKPAKSSKIKILALVALLFALIGSALVIYFVKFSS